METTQVRQETASQPAAPQKEQKGAAPKVPMPRKKKKWIKRVIVLAVLAALLKQAVGAGLTARGLDENGEPRRNLPGGPQEN